SETAQRHHAARQMRCPRRRLIARLGAIANETPGAADGPGGNPAPYRAPGEVRDRHHALRVDALVRLGQYLIDVTATAQRVARAARAAHAHRVPLLDLLELVVAFHERNQDLVRGLCIWCTARREQDTIRLCTVRHDRAVLDERHAAAVALHGA